jgi:leucyl aminopeptidase
MPASDFFTDHAAGACPVHPVDHDSLATLLTALSDGHRAWVRSLAWQPRPGAVLALAGGEGSVAAALAGTGGPEPFWALAAIPGQLPPGVYTFADAADLEQSTRRAVAWGLGQYAFSLQSKYKAPEPRRLAWPEGVDRARVLSIIEADALVRDLVNTPAGEMGPEELSRAAAALAATAGAGFREVVGEALLAEGFPAIHAVGRASHRAPR